MSASGLIETWASLYANHALLRTVIVFCHVGGLLVGGGTAVTADRATLRAFSRGEGERSRHLEALARTHKLVMATLAIIIASGFLQFFSDTASFLHSRVFWFKMGLVVALLLNGVWLTVVEARAAARAPQAEPEWRRLRVVSIFSLGLWLGIVLAGAGLISM